MEWKKVSYKKLEGWEVELPSTYSGGKEVVFRCPTEKAHTLELLRSLQDVYGVDYKIGQPNQVIWQMEQKGGRTYVKLPLLEGKNLKLITEDFVAADWKFICTCRRTEYQTYEEVLLQNVVIKLSESAFEALGDLGNILLEYQQLMKFADVLTSATGKLDKTTFEAHRKFLEDGLTKKLNLPKDTLVKWIQSVVGTEADGRYGLETWLLVKPHTIGEGKRFIAPAAATPEELREKFIPYKLLGSKPREIVDLMLEEQRAEAEALKPIGRTPAERLEWQDKMKQIAASARAGWDELLVKQMKEEIAQFNKFAQEHRKQREEIERRSQELFNRVFNNLGWYSSEELLGETLTSIIRAWGPQSPEDLVLDIVLAALTAGIVAYIGKTLIQARRVARAKRAIALSKRLGLSKRSQKVLQLTTKGYSPRAALAATRGVARRQRWIASLPRKTRRAAAKAAKMAERWSDDLLRKYPGQKKIAHHLLPEGGKKTKFFRRKFERIFGKDIIDDWLVPLPEKYHPSSVHRGTRMKVRGGWWNAQWKKFFERPVSELTPEKVFKHLEKLIKEVSRQ